MTSRGLLSWVLLALALAVPGFLFYRWKTNVNTESERQLSQKVRVKMPDGGPFANAPTGSKLTNPISEAGSQTSTATAPSAPSAPESPKEPSAPAPVPAPAPDDAVGQSPAPTAAPAAPAAAPAAPAVAALSRDPFLSPHDLQLIERKRREALERREAAQRPRDAASGRRAKREVRPEQAVDLQGIVSGADGRARAIVNGEMVREGDFVRGVRVVKITPQSVIFLHKNRKFTKSVSK